MSRSDRETARPPQHGSSFEHAPPPSTALQSLIVDHGVGTMLGLAIGDVAVHGRGYSSRTQAATIIAYQLLEHGEIRASDLVDAMLELGQPGDSVFTDPSPAFMAWLQSAAAGTPAASAVPTSESATRSIPLGVWFRDDPDALVAEVVELSRLETVDAGAIATAVAVAGAVAAATLAMSGWDMVMAAAETSERVWPVLRRSDLSRTEGARQVATMLGAVKNRVGHSFADIAAGLADVDPSLRPPLTAVVMAADAEAAPALVIESAGVAGGVDASVVAGGILGARLGLRRWPWRVHNETWFAEIGRRLVEHERETRDLPVPRGVEARVRSAAPIDPSREVD